jgi:hypothetical protein
MNLAIAIRSKSTSAPAPPVDTRHEQKHCLSPLGTSPTGPRKLRKRALAGPVATTNKTERYAHRPCASGAHNAAPATRRSALGHVTDSEPICFVPSTMGSGIRSRACSRSGWPRPFPTERTGPTRHRLLSRAKFYCYLMARMAHRVGPGKPDLPDGYRVANADDGDVYVLDGRSPCPLVTVVQRATAGGQHSNRNPRVVDAVPTRAGWCGREDPAIDESGDLEPICKRQSTFRSTPRLITQMIRDTGAEVFAGVPVANNIVELRLIGRRHRARS